MSTANNTDTMRNSGAPITIDRGTLRKIRKNTMPFQAKARLRKTFSQVSVLAPGRKNTRQVRNNAATVMAIEIGHVAWLYVPTRAQNTSVLTICYLLPV
jgi:hypothetical protein